MADVVAAHDDEGKHPRMKALMVGGPRNGHMVSVSRFDGPSTDGPVVTDNDVWPPVFVDVASATSYRRFPIHYGEPSPLVPGRVATRWDAVVYLHETIRSDDQVAAFFPSAATLWWFRETATATDPNAPVRFTPPADQNGSTPA